MRQGIGLGVGINRSQYGFAVGTRQWQLITEKWETINEFWNL
jgi:hypothetical protein